MEWSVALRIKHYCRETGNNLQRNQVKAPDTSVTFYPRVVNKTDVDFSNEELSLLNIGMKYICTRKRTG